jgi:type VI secretion system protein ImpE
MNASELYKAGKLQEAIAAQTQEVKSNPGDKARRLFLFEMLVFAGDIDRARKQLDVLKFAEMELESAVASYRKLLESEEKRRKLFSQGLKPDFLGETPEHVNLRLEALNRLREKQPAEAAKLLDQAAEKTPVIKGQLNGKPFEGLRDADDFFGGVLEVMAQGNYYWLPLEQIENIAMKPPRYPRDLIWIPARLDLESSSGEVFLPATYPGTYEQSDDQLKLGRGVDWKGADGEPVQGAGLHMFLAGDADINLLDWRELKIDK